MFERFTLVVEGALRNPASHGLNVAITQRWPIPGHQRATFMGTDELLVEVAFIWVPRNDHGLAPAEGALVD